MQMRFYAVLAAALSLVSAPTVAQGFKPTRPVEVVIHTGPGGGSDVFTFRSVSESHGSAIDTIRVFVRGADRIDLRGIDADIAAAGDQAFTFIGASAFSGEAGELTFSRGVLSGDVNGDRIADVRIAVSGPSALSAGDFYL